jgi:hypothetical protein
MDRQQAARRQLRRAFVSEARSAQTTISVERSMSKCPIVGSLATQDCVPLVNKSSPNGPEMLPTGNL